jgi:hypothetical protein
MIVCAGHVASGGRLPWTIWETTEIEGSSLVLVTNQFNKALKDPGTLP